MPFDFTHQAQDLGSERSKVPSFTAYKQQRTILHVNSSCTERNAKEMS
jgi:hypothetical protein